MTTTMTLAAVALAGAAGCSTPKSWQLTGQNVAAQRAQRREEAAKVYESHRDMAQYEAAIGRWESGDPFSCESQLRSLLGRNPKHVLARRALADLALERGDVTAAERELRAALQAAPDDAQTHHSLALLLELQQRPSEAQPHFAQAAQLAPDNPLYQLSLAAPAAQPSPARF